MGKLMCTDFEEVALTTHELELGLADLALKLVAVTDTAACHFKRMQHAGGAWGNDWAVMALHFEVRTVAAARAVAWGLVADLGMLGNQSHARRSDRVLITPHMA